jgi:hypothetical protein
MTALADFAENLVLNWLLTDGAATRPTSWFVALHTGDPGESGSANELVGNGYARQAVTFEDAASGATQNEAQLTFGPNTGTNWGQVTHISVWDAASGGNCLFKGALSSAVTINVGDSLVIGAGNLDISLD